MWNIWNCIKYSWLDSRIQKKVKNRYYHNREFFVLDQALLTAYFFKNPYKMCQDHLIQPSENNQSIYGETPLPTYEAIAREVHLKPKDIVLELGSGRGRGVFFLHHFFKCRVIGIETVPHFVNVSRYLSRKYSIEGVSFIHANLFESNWPEATILYLYGTTLNFFEITRLIEILKKYPKGTKIVSISYPLSEYNPNMFCNSKRFSVSFLWGETHAYVQTIR